MNYSNGNCDAKLYAHAQSFCVVMLGKPLCAMAKASLGAARQASL
jgi:hypothetical protein